MTANQIGREGWQPAVLTVRPAVLDQNVLLLDVTGLPESRPERGNMGRGISCCPTGEQPDHGYRWPLRTNTERQREKAETLGNRECCANDDHASTRDNPPSTAAIFCQPSILRNLICPLATMLKSSDRDYPGASTPPAALRMRKADAFDRATIASTS